MINGIRKRLSHLIHPIQGEIWCLHRIVDKRSDYPSNRELELTTDYLESLILKHIAEGFSFVTIDSILQGTSIFPQKRINISFDDGFKDVYTNAFPIFRKYHIPFTLYLSTDFPEGKADIWWIQLEKISSKEEFEQLMKAIYDSGLPMAERMHDLTGTTPDMELCHSLSLSWEDIQEMLKSGLCTIGSHTVSHPGLTRISPEKRQFELRESKRIIKERTGIDAVHFSYPHSLQDNAVKKEVSDSGYVSAALGFGGCVRKNDDKYLLHRKYIIQR